MAHFRASGCLVELSAPVLVGRAAGHHWFSSLHAAGADILCQAIKVADIAQGQWPGYMYRSSDGGDSWLQVQDVASVSHSSVPLKTSDEILVMPYELWPATPGDRRNAVADGTVLSLGGTGIEARPEPVRFTDLPRDLLEYSDGELCLLTNGSIVAVDGGWLTTLYGRFEPAADQLQYACMAFASADGGFTWQFRSVVADSAQTPGACEGPNESNTARLPDGRLLCIFRVGSGRQYPYYRCYSADEGCTWTDPQPVADADELDEVIERGVALLLELFVSVWVPGRG
ncbi:MAG: exo-alpha-sialidase [Proteobacteria bacterium]|nr:exo-alpha-sialidase [Pseudomonadota bacterium]